MAASLLGYKIIPNNLPSNQVRETMVVEADKVNGSISTTVSKSNESPFIYKLTDGYSDSHIVSSIKDYFIIPTKSVEQLQLDLYLQDLIIYLLIILLVFLIIKKLS